MRLRKWADIDRYRHFARQTPDPSWHIEKVKNWITIKLEFGVMDDVNKKVLLGDDQISYGYPTGGDFLNQIIF